jgi:hypothetical protein
VDIIIWLTLLSVAITVKRKRSEKGYKGCGYQYKKGRNHTGSDDIKNSYLLVWY